MTMADDYTIEFKGIDNVSSVIQDIIDKIDQLDDSDGGSPGDGPSILVDAAQMAPEVEEVMWDILDKIKTRAIEDGTEFLLDTSE